MSTPLPNSTDQHVENEPVKQDTIFNDVADISGYDKNLKTARIYLYIVAALHVGIGVYEYVTIEDNTLKLWAMAVDAGIGAIFFGLALWSYKQASLAFGIALVLYILLQIVIIYFDTSMIYKGIILKVLVIVALVKGFKDAREYEQIKRSLGINASNAQ